MNKKTALVTDLKVIDSPQAGLGVARSLKKAGFEVIGVDDTPLVTTNPDLFKKVLCWEELRTLNFDSLIKKIINVKEIYGLDFIFPCYDETAILFSFIKDKFDYLDISLICPPKNIIKKLRKSNLKNVIKTNKEYAAPQSMQFNKIESAKKFAEKLGYPVVCKGLTKGAYVSKNEKELKQNIRKISDIWNNGEIDCLVEEYIEGEYVNCIVAIKEGSIVGYVEMEKIGLDQNGATWFGKISKSKNILPLAKQLVEKLDFQTSVIEIETIKKEGKYYIYEINPRCPAWIYAPCLLGLNLPELVCLSSGKTQFVKSEVSFGRETKHFIRQDISGYEDRVGFYSKGAAYKNKDLKYPSDLLL